MPEAIDADKRHHVLGVQGNHWSEYFYEPWQVEYHAFPRMLAVAEVAWTPLEKKDFADFERRVQNMQKRLDYHDIRYYIPQPEQEGGSLNTVAFVDPVTLKFTTTNSVDKIIYTLDGSEPTLKNLSLIHIFVALRIHSKVALETASTCEAYSAVVALSEVCLLYTSRCV